jgi:hypothetical protein
VTVVTGEGARALHELSRPFHQEYARRLKADYVVLTDDPPAPELPITAKFRIGRVLDYYERAVFMDADALPLPGCPDLFAMVAPDEFAFTTTCPA